MSPALLHESRTVADKPRDKKPARDRVDLRVDPALNERLERQATRLGLTVSAYLRMAAIRQLEQDEATDPDA